MLQANWGKSDKQQQWKNSPNLEQRTLADLCTQGGKEEMLVAHRVELTQVDETHKTKFSLLWRHGSTFLRVGDVLEAKRWIPQYI